MTSIDDDEALRRGGQELAALSATERLLNQKELQLRRYISENFSKIRDVERQLAELRLEFKLTSGSKKAALEFMRKRIEEQSTKVALARQKHLDMIEATRLAEASWRAEEAVKEQLCKDLQLLVHDSTHAQFQKLEELTAQLDLLTGGVASSAGRADASGATAAAVHTPPPSSGHAASREELVELPPSSGPGGSTPVVGADDRTLLDRGTGAAVATDDGSGDRMRGKAQRKVNVVGRQASGSAVGKVRGRLVQPRDKPEAAAWTGSGFD